VSALLLGTGVVNFGDTAFIGDWLYLDRYIHRVLLCGAHADEFFVDRRDETSSPLPGVCSSQSFSAKYVMPNLWYICMVLCAFLCTATAKEPS